MKTGLLILVLLFSLNFGFTSYGNNSSISNKEEYLQKIENFEIFFNRFCNNPKFQLQRVKFPFRQTLVGITGEPNEEVFIERKDWIHTNFIKLSKKYNISKRKRRNGFIINLQLLDTGVFEDYYFELVSGKWMMIKMIDSGT